MAYPHSAITIVGPTATGKTALALHLAQKFHGEIISTDSRQVYKSMDIGTGKDLPKDTVLELQNIDGFPEPLTSYRTQGTRIWLIDQVNPDQEWSLAHFIQASRAIMKHLWKTNTLPIIVGGTGLYAQSMTSSYETASIPQNQNLRKELENKTVAELQLLLQKYDVKKYDSMNHSDQNNPRRLIRAIEVARYLQNNALKDKSEEHISIYWIGLKKPWDVLEKDIHTRVASRLTQGMVDEVNKLMQTYKDWTTPAFSSLGYRETRDFIEKKMTQQELIETWALHELQYAKRQMVWFKKRPDIHWFSTESGKPYNDVEKLVSDWYDEAYAAH